MPQSISPTDKRLTWAGAASVENHNTDPDSWSMPWRVDYGQKPLFAPELIERAAMPAGVRITFRSDTTTLAGNIVPFAEEASIDLCSDASLVGSVALQHTNSFRFDALPAGEKTLALWLPQFGQFQLRDLSIDLNASLSLYEDRRPRWITYGSSITQCRTAPTPTQTWPAIVARTHNLNLTCLGFGGQCHLDSMIARQIRDTPADFISMCLGINIYGNGSLNPRSFGPSILGFVQIVREKHPVTPIVLMSPIFSPGREETVNAAGFTLSQMRTEVERTVQILQEAGDAHVEYVNGLDIFGSDLAHLLPDDLHPNGEGYRIMGQRFGQVVMARYFGGGG